MTGITNTTTDKPKRQRKPRTIPQSQVVSFRVAPKEFAQLAQEAKAQQRTPSDVARDRMRDAQRMAQLQAQFVELQNTVRAMQQQFLAALEDTKAALMSEYMQTVTDQAIGNQVEKTLVALLKTVHAKNRPNVPTSLQQGDKHGA